MSKSASAGVHWLTGTTYLDYGEVLDLVHEWSGGISYEVMSTGRWGYRSRVRGPEGLEVLSEPIEPDSMPPVCVNVPGAACEWLGAERLQLVASILKPTRVDFAWDGVPFTVADVASWISAGNTRTRARRAIVHGPLLEGTDDGHTVELGSRTSTWLLDVYDRRGPVRAELRLRGERAEDVYSVLMDDPSSWSGAFLARLRGLVEFVDRSQAERAEDCPLLPSWEAFVSGAARLVVALAGRPAASLERARQWVADQVAPTLWMLHTAGVRLGSFLQEGRRRATPRRRALAAVWSARALSPLPSG